MIGFVCEHAKTILRRCENKVVVVNVPGIDIFGNMKNVGIKGGLGERLHHTSGFAVTH
jgi:hypothetical protein